MEPVIVKNVRREIVFFPDRLEIMKRNEIIETISYDEIKNAVYNPEFNLKDLLVIMLILPDSHLCLPNAFTVVFRSKGRFFRLTLSNGEYEKIKDIFKPPIELI